jgi:trehalose-6-phosphate synthase
VRVSKRAIPPSPPSELDSTGDHSSHSGNSSDSDSPTTPVRFEWHVEWAGDRVIEAQNSFSHRELQQRGSVKFIGRIPEWDVPVDEQPALAAKLREFNCFPVFAPPEEARLYYEEYCKQSLWPTFHNVIDVYSPIDVIPEGDTDKPAHYWTPDSQKLAWQAYANVNQLFATVSSCLFHHVIPT